MAAEGLAYKDATNDSRLTPPDLREFFATGRDYLGDARRHSANVVRLYKPNIWLAHPPTFRDVARAYCSMSDELFTMLLRAAALAFGLPEHYFDDKVNRNFSTLNTNYYPAQREVPLPGQLRAGIAVRFRAFGGKFTGLFGSTPGIAAQLAADRGLVASNQSCNLRDVVLGFHKAMKLIYFNLAEVFVTHRATSTCTPGSLGC